MTKEEQNLAKRNAGFKAAEFIKDDMLVGVGTGSTANYFIEALAPLKNKIKGVVASSERSANLLRKYGFTVLSLNEVFHLDIYVDGADEIDQNFCMIKGGGAALTREKLVSSVAQKFIAIVDSSKVVAQIGKFPVAVEVLEMARSFVAREITKLGGRVQYREKVVTDNGHQIIDVWNLDLTTLAKAKLLEEKINNIPGVIANGIFAHRLADICLVGTKDGVNVFRYGIDDLKN